MGGTAEDPAPDVQASRIDRYTTGEFAAFCAKLPRPLLCTVGEAILPDKHITVACLALPRQEVRWRRAPGRPDRMRVSCATIARRPPANTSLRVPGRSRPRLPRTPRWHPLPIPLRRGKRLPRSAPAATTAHRPKHRTCV